MLGLLRSVPLAVRVQHHVVTKCAATWRSLVSTYFSKYSWWMSFFLNPLLVGTISNLTRSSELMEWELLTCQRILSEIHDSTSKLLPLNACRLYIYIYMLHFLHNSCYISLCTPSLLWLPTIFPHYFQVVFTYRSIYNQNILGVIWN